MRTPNERYEVTSGVLRINDLPLLLPKGFVYRTLLRAGWKGAEGLLSDEVVERLVGSGPLHALFQNAAHNARPAIA